MAGGSLPPYNTMFGGVSVWVLIGKRIINSSSVFAISYDIEPSYFWIQTSFGKQKNLRKRLTYILKTNDLLRGHFLIQHPLSSTPQPDVSASLKIVQFTFGNLVSFLFFLIKFYKFFLHRITPQKYCGRKLHGLQGLLTLFATTDKTSLKI